MSHATISTVLFDLDGTLLDTAPQFLVILNQLLAEHDLDPITLDALRPQVGYGSLAMLKAGFGETLDLAELASLQETFFTRYHQNLYEYTVPFPGVETLIQQLVARDITWGIVTNKPDWLAQPLLNYYPFAQSAACLIGAGLTPRGKPYPDPLLLACEKINATPKHCVYVGDSEVDIMAGNAAQMQTLVASYGYVIPGTDINGWQASGVIEEAGDVITWLDCYNAT